MKFYILFVIIFCQIISSFVQGNDPQPEPESIVRPNEPEIEILDIVFPPQTL